MNLEDIAVEIGKAWTIQSICFACVNFLFLLFALHKMIPLLKRGSMCRFSERTFCFYFLVAACIVRVVHYPMYGRGMLNEGMDNALLCAAGLFLTVSFACVLLFWFQILRTLDYSVNFSINALYILFTCLVSPFIILWMLMIIFSSNYAIYHPIGLTFNIAFLVALSLIPCGLFIFALVMLSRIRQLQVTMRSLDLLGEEPHLSNQLRKATLLLAIVSLVIVIATLIEIIFLATGFSSNKWGIFSVTICMRCCELFTYYIIMSIFGDDINNAESQKSLLGVEEAK